MASSVIGALRVMLGLDTAEFESGTSRAERQSQRLERQMARTGRNLQRTGRNLTLALTAPLAAFGVSSFSAASDAAELQSAFDQTFGDMAGDMNRWAEETGDAMGRSTQSMQQLANTFGIFFNQAAPTREEAARMSQTFAELAQDLASFYNVAEEDALGKLRSGLAGEAEPLRDFGVFLSAAAVEARALEMGLADASGEISEQDKILARYNLILEATTNAQGDVARTADGTANQMRRAGAAFEELKVSIGNILLPIFTPLIENFGKAVNFLAQLPPGAQAFGVALAGIAAAAGPVLFVFGSILTNFAAIKVAFLAASPWLAGFAAAGLLIYANWDKIGPALEDIGRGMGLIESHTTGAVNELTAAFDSVTAAAISSGAATEEEVDRIVSALGAMSREGVVDPAATTAITELIYKMEQAGTIAPEQAELVRAALLDAWQAEGLDAEKSGWEQLGEDIVAFNDQMQTWTDQYDAWLQHRSAMAREFWGNVWSSFEAFSETLKETGDSIKAWLSGFVADMVNMGRDIIAGLVQGIRNGANNFRDSVVGVVSDGVQSARNFLGIRSPSLLFMEMGGYMMEGMAIGIAAKRTLVSNEIEGLAARTAEQTAEIGNSFESMAQTALGSFDRLLNGIKSGGITDILGGLLGGLQAFGVLGDAGGQSGSSMFGGIFSSIFGGGSGPKVPKFATGGAMKLGGYSGVDTNLLSLNGSPIARVSAGETMSIRPANDRGGQVVHNHYTLPSEEFWSRVDGRADGRIGVAAPSIVKTATGETFNRLGRSRNKALA